MADLPFIPDDDQDNQDEGLDCNTFKIIEDNVAVDYDKYTVVENFRRQFVGRVVSDALRDIRECPADVSVVADIVNKLANDSEVAVRAELMEQVPHIAMLYHNKRNSLHHLINDTLLPLVTKFLADEDNQVRKTAQATLLVLVEQGLVDSSVIEETVCPIIITLTENDSLIEYQSGTVALMGKMAPLIGSSATEQLFLTRFAELCSSPTFATRQVCAANFGDFCAVIGSACAETILLPKFVELCADEIWGVRKACADVFMSVSCACSISTRKCALAPVFANLLTDSSRWVQISAFQRLGPFISTFADPSITGLAYNQQGELVVVNPEGLEFSINSTQISDSDQTKIWTNVSDNEVQHDRESVSNDQTITFQGNSDKASCENKQTEEVPRGKYHIHLESSLASFNTFQYWRVPIPELELDISLTNELKPAVVHVKAKVTDETSRRTFSSELNVNMDVDLDLNNLAAHLEQNMRIGEGCGVHADICTASMAVVTDADNKESRILGSSAQHSVIWVQPDSTNAVTTRINCVEETLQSWSQPLQDIVPQVLVNQFVSMSDQSFAKTIDLELPHHCAFSIPAVALTLGRANWNLIRKAYESLASDMQWKVRRTLACSIHELAVILGEDIATKDLVPIFNGFIKDLDEVRIGALKHLAEFLKFLRPHDRNSYLPRLQDFLYTDNTHNWRFRNELAEQLITAIPLFTPSDTHKHISPLAISLLKDNVAHVRQVSVNLVTKLVHHIMVEQSLVRGLLLHLIQQFAHSKQWIRRQTFALVCAQFLACGILNDKIFAADILPHLLDLSVDEVPNVRLVVARTLATSVTVNAESNPHYNVFIRVLQKLQWDTDRDVRSYAVQIH